MIFTHLVQRNYLNDRKTFDIYNILYVQCSVEVS